jgi:hypothetical protein
MVRTGANIPLPPGTEEIATKIADAAYTVHKALGPGLLENVYEVCFCHELKKTRPDISKAGVCTDHI